MTVAERVQAHREEILAIAARRGATNLRMFGSVARGEDTDKSDLDLLIALERGRRGWNYIALIRELEELLGCKVDVVLENGIDKYIRAQVLAEAVPL